MCARHQRPQGHLEAVTKHQMIPQQHAVHQLVEIRLRNVDGTGAHALMQIAANAAAAGHRRQ